MRNHSNENDFDLQENETACRTHFYMKGERFLTWLVLKQRHMSTKTWPIKPYFRKGNDRKEPEKDSDD